MIGGGAARAGELLLEPARRVAAGYVVPGLGTPHDDPARPPRRRAPACSARRCWPSHELAGRTGSPAPHGGRIVIVACGFDHAGYRAARPAAAADRGRRPRGARLRDRSARARSTTPTRRSRSGTRSPPAGPSAGSSSAARAPACRSPRARSAGSARPRSTTTTPRTRASSTTASTCSASAAA